MAKTGPIHPISKAIYAFLQDHPASLNEIVAAIGPTIPPGEALRRYESAMTTERNGQPRPYNASGQDQDQLLRQARRHTIKTFMRNLRNGGTITVTTGPQGQEIWTQLTETPNLLGTIKRLRNELTQLLLDQGHSPECPWFPAATTYPHCPHPHHREWEG